MFPRCGIPDWFEGWDDWESYVRFLYETGSITEHTQVWWSVRPHLAFPTVEMRICDGQPDIGEARSLAALIYSLTARIARAIDEGEPLPSWPHRLLEENLWRAIRYGLSGELIDLERGESIPARARIEQLSSGCSRSPTSSARRRGSRSRSGTPPSGRSRATRRARRWRRSSPSRCGPVSESQAEPSAQEQLVDELRKAPGRRPARPPRSMLASLAYGKLAPDLRDLEQAQLAIDALRALAAAAPGGAARDIQQVVDEPAARVRGRRRRLTAPACSRAARARGRGAARACHGRRRARGAAVELRLSDDPRSPRQRDPPAAVASLRATSPTTSSHTASSRGSRRRSRCRPSASARRARPRSSARTTRRRSAGQRHRMAGACRGQLRRVRLRPAARGERRGRARADAVHAVDLGRLRARRHPRPAGGDPRARPASSPRPAARADERAALYRYNPSWAYVDAIERYAGRIRRDPQAFLVFYARRLIVRTPAGLPALLNPDRSACAT